MALHPLSAWLRNADPGQQIRALGRYSEQRVVITAARCWDACRERHALVGYVRAGGRTADHTFMGASALDDAFYVPREDNDARAA